MWVPGFFRAIVAPVLARGGLVAGAIPSTGHESALSALNGGGGRPGAVSGRVSVPLSSGSRGEASASRASGGR